MEHSCSRNTLLAGLLLLSLSDLAYSFTVQITPIALNRPVGARIQFDISVSPPTPNLWMRLRVRPAGGTFSVVEDFDPYHNNQFNWAAMEEGTWDIEVAAKDPATQETAVSTIPYNVASRIAGTSPVVNPVEGNTLMALYSVPACNSGNIRVSFWPASTPADKTSTRSLPCKPGKSLNFWIAGMRANTPYSLQHQSVSGWSVIGGPTLSFTTGAQPVANSVVLQTPNASTSTLDKVSFEIGLIPSIRCVAYDLAGNPIWYYNATANGSLTYCLRPVSGGSVLLVPAPTSGTRQTILREIDLAGNILKETNVSRLNEQLTALGKATITGIHHDAFRLPNGYTAVVVSREKLLTDVQQPGPVNVLGDGVIVLDRDFQVTWSWDSFEKLDPSYRAVLGEFCTASLAAGCPPYFNSSFANDWTHANSVSYTTDGNLVVSLRHIDWVVKVNYANGAGNGDVLWKFGPNGDFTITNPGGDPYPFQSHQHSATYKNGKLWVYDNGNTRVGLYGGNSRGQVFALNEATRTATVELSADLTVYAPALGTAQRLSNGNYSFSSYLGSTVQGLEHEVVPNPQPQGTLNYQLLFGNVCYRAYRMRDLYTLVD